MFNKNVNLLIGIDLDEKLLKNSKDNLQPLSLEFILKPESPCELFLLSGDISTPPDSLMNILKSGSLDFVSLVEVIEHMYQDCLEKTVDVVFGQLRPKVVAITTPNGEFNVVFNSGDEVSPENIKKFRHYDHKFEWSREEFQKWCLNILEIYNYGNCYFDGVGDAPNGFEKVGNCSQIAVFVVKKTLNDLNNNNKTFSGINEDEPSILTEYVNKLQQTEYPQDFSPLVTDATFTGSSYKLIDTIRFPYDLKLDSNSNEKILNELNWLIIFMTRPSGGNSMDWQERLSEEERQECIENGIDIYEEEARLISIEHLLKFSSIKKFNLNESDVKRFIKMEDRHKITKSGKYIIYYPNLYTDHHSLFDDSKDMPDDDDDDEKNVDISVADLKLDENWSSECIPLHLNEAVDDPREQFEDTKDDELNKSSLNDNFQSNFRFLINLNALEKPNNYYYEEAKLFSKKMKSIRKRTRNERRKPAEDEPFEQFEDI